MKHTVLTFIAKVDPARVAALRDLLLQIRNTLATNTDLPFRELKTLHFASLVLHEAHPQYGPYLIFENNFDGELAEYLKELSLHAASGLHKIFGSCTDYSVQSSANRGEIEDYLQAHVVRPSAYHIGNTGRTAKQISEEQKLHDALEAAADQLIKQGKLKTPGELFSELKSVLSTPDFATLGPVGPRESFLDRCIAWARLGLVVLLIIGFCCIRPPWALLLLLATIILAVINLYLLERSDAVQEGPANSANLRELVKNEDLQHSVQNHMISITIVKDGWFRRLVLRSVLWAVNLLARVFSTHGKLSGIPGIHFAHWSMIDGGKRLLFLSNFDGSWENYLDDFIDKAHDGLTAVWSNTMKFPRSHFLVGGGASDGPRFKAVARDGQAVTNVWYSAYLDLTVENIDNDSSIREELFTQLDDKAKAAWLRRL